MRLIDADEINVKRWFAFPDNRKAMAEALAAAPTVDAVPVVRCKDCIHAVAITNLTIANRCGLGQKNCMRQRGDDGFGFTGVSVVYPDGFCDEGERMDGEAE